MRFSLRRRIGHQRIAAWFNLNSSSMTFLMQRSTPYQEVAIKCIFGFYDCPIRSRKCDVGTTSEGTSADTNDNKPEPVQVHERFVHDIVQLFQRVIQKLI